MPNLLLTHVVATFISSQNLLHQVPPDTYRRAPAGPAASGVGARGEERLDGATLRARQRPRPREAALPAAGGGPQPRRRLAAGAIFVQVSSGFRASHVLERMPWDCDCDLWILRLLPVPNSRSLAPYLAALVPVSDCSHDGVPAVRSDVWQVEPTAPPVPAHPALALLITYF